MTGVTTGGAREPAAAAAAVELRDAADVAGWLAVGLAVRRIAPGEPEPGAGSGAGIVEAGELDDDRVARMILSCANELPALPPPGVISDIAALLAGARLPIGAPAGLGGAGSMTTGDGLRAALRAYDDDVLARVVQASRFDDLLAAYAHAALADRGAAVALVVGALCERAGFTGVVVSPAALRRALGRPRADREAAGRAGLAGGAAARALADAYHRLARGARHSRALIDDRDVFAVDHLAVLRDFGGRMTAAHLAAAAAAIAQRLPRRLPSRRELRGQRDTRLADDTLYPAGGFASITPGGATTGNIENLVTSELMYMEDGPEDGPGHGDGIDLFALRYVEGELLHYTRDDSVFRRHSHVIDFALGAELDAARVKDRALPWQRLILVLGWLMAVIRWLIDQLGDQALTVRVAFPPRVLAEEQQIFALLLDAEVARGTVVVVEDSWQTTAAAAAQSGAGAIADLVVISLGELPEIPRGVRALHIDLADPSPAVVELAPRRGARGEPGSDPWLDWCEAAEDLLRWLV